jgi:hypothetical protein
VLAATFSLAVVCLAAPARAQAPAPGAVQPAPPPASGYPPVQAPPQPNPYAQPGGSPPASQYPAANPPPANYGYGQPAYPAQQPQYPPPAYGYPPPATMPVARAEEPERFGRRGQVVITQGFGIISNAENTSRVRLSPAFNFFVANHFSVGFDATFEYISYEGSSQSYKNFGIGLTLGGNIPMGSVLSLWPTLNNAYWVPDSGSNQASTSITVPLLIHVAPHFFIAVGPELFMYRNLSGSGSQTDLHFTQSLTSFIGGWW